MKNKLVYIIAAAVLVIAVAVGLTIYFASNSYVATVAGEKITKPEYQFFLNAVKAEMLSSVTDEQTKSTFWESKVDGQNARDVAKDKALDKAKEFKIQLIKAKQSNLALTKEELNNIETSIDDMIKKAPGGRNEVEKEIKDTYGINLSQYKNIYMDYMLVLKYLDQEVKKISTSDDELKKYYDEHKKQYEQVTVRHVLFMTVDSENKPLAEDKQAEAKKKAEDILAKVKAGEDISALAKQYSEDPGSKDTGGEYTFPKGQMVPEFEDWAFKAKVGDVGMVKTQYGYHVMKLEKIPGFEDYKDNIQKSVQENKYKEQLDQWKKDQQFNILKNERVLKSIKIA